VHAPHLDVELEVDAEAAGHGLEHLNQEVNLWRRLRIGAAA
jgi:hypothetical protein